MKIVIVTDAWEPQVNGVVRTLGKTRDYLQSFGHEVCMVTPQDFRTIPCPSYPSIRLALFPYRSIKRVLGEFNANAIHIATEGPLGQAARRWCLRHNVHFTTSYHTQFPEYVRLRAPIPLSWSYAFLRRFHKPAVRTLVPTASQKQRLIERGFESVEVWGRGVDTTIFKADNPIPLDLPRPIFVNMGRVAVEKNIEAFLDLDLPGSKLVIGEGPDLAMLQKRYPTVTFAGVKFGEELASYLAACDVFVFPSKTDTFGLVILEAMACGLPVAAYPVTGPVDIIENGSTGIVNNDLEVAARQALALNKADCVHYASLNSWTACSRVFESMMFNNTAQTRDTVSARSMGQN
ncbi:MAG: glycosyltransferase family 1 protein [Methylophaga sp.]|nr:glycosyltransferase family 1 protein [Methylophaga sp.]